jgi:hypothetical protein
MKKLVNLVVAVMLIGTILVGCGGSRLSGKYVDESNRTLVFSGSDKVKLNDFEGTYKVEDGEITFVFKGNVQNYKFSIINKSLIIDGVEYKKSK